MDEGDEFDDDLFELLGDQIDALEQQAIHSTQAAKTQHDSINELGTSQYNYEQHGNGDEDDEIIDTNHNGFNNVPAPEALPSYLPASTQHNTTADSLNRQAYTYTASAARPPLPAAHLALAHRPNSQAVLPVKDTHNAAAAASHPGSAGVDVIALQAQVAELLKERERLESSLSEAKNQVITKTGEIAIVRSRNEKVIREKDLQLEALRKETNAAQETHRSELEQTRRQQEQQNTASRFADHDKIIAKARKRTQPARQDEDVIIKRSALPPFRPHNTPKRDRHASPGDGFSTDERSPVKPASQALQRTPRAADKKRKRLPESPIKPLAMIEDDSFMLMDDGSMPIAVPVPAPSATQTQLPDKRYEILQRFLNRRIQDNRQRTLEVFATQTFPSDKSSPFSTKVLDQIAKLRPEIKTEDYTAALCGTIMGLWTQCLKEKYYEPVVYLSDLVSYMLSHDHDAISAVMDDLVPLAQKTADVNCLPRFKSTLRRTAGEIGKESEHVSIGDCLELLLQISSYCCDRPDLRERFWVLVRMDLLSMLLRPVQDVENICLACRLLSYSIRPDGFGPVLGEPTSQSGRNGFTKTRAEDHLVDRLTALLIEVPRNPTVGNPYTQVEITDMRLEVLAVIECFTQSEHSAQVFARHTTAMGRLVRCANDQFHYAMELLFGWERRLQVVSEATRLLYHFIYRFKGDIDINEKLRAIPGGAHKYLIVLTRLAFSEGGIWGKEIDEDVVDCAHELLEDHVNPEEGEALMAAFQSGHSRR